MLTNFSRRYNKRPKIRPPLATCAVAKYWETEAAISHNRCFLAVLLLSTTILTFMPHASRAADSYIVNQGTEASALEYQNQQAHIASRDFISDINYARRAIAEKKGVEASQHVQDAKNLIEKMREVSSKEHGLVWEESGRIQYEYDTEYKYHYFPIETGPMNIKKMGHGPVWAKNNLAITDAQIVYLTIDLGKIDVEKQLTKTQSAVAANDFKAADKLLVKLVKEIVTVDNKTAVPLDKALGNIALAQNFVAATNYDGARYSLKHADDALDQLENDKGYNSHSASLIKMREEITDLQVIISRKDTNMAEKYGKILSKWWTELKGWSAKT